MCISVYINIIKGHHCLNRNLNGNNLNGSVPQSLLDREKEGLVLK